MGKKKKRRIDWLNHGLEFSVVLIGILIAFQLNKYSENNSQKALIENHLQELKLEANENISRLEAGIKHATNTLKKADSLLTFITKKGNPATLKGLSTALLDLRDVNIKKDAYKVLTESGDIRFLANFEDKRNIILLYEQYSSVQKADENALKIYDNYYYPFIKNNFDLVNWNLPDNNPEVNSKYHSKEFGNIVSTYRYLLNSKIMTYQKTIKTIKNYLKNR